MKWGYKIFHIASYNVFSISGVLLKVSQPSASSTWPNLSFKQNKIHLSVLRAQYVVYVLVYPHCLWCCLGGGRQTLVGWLLIKMITLFGLIEANSSTGTSKIGTTTVNSLSHKSIKDHEEHICNQWRDKKQPNGQIILGTISRGFVSGQGFTSYLRGLRVKIIRVDKFSYKCPRKKS